MNVSESMIQNSIVSSSTSMLAWSGSSEQEPKENTNLP